MHAIGISERLDISINDTIETLENILVAVNDEIEKSEDNEVLDQQETSAIINKRLGLLQKYIQLLY